MELYIVRHGDAVDRQNADIATDAVRPLTDKGRDEAALAATLLQRLDITPDLFLSSPMVRARQTAEIIRDALAPEAQIHFAEELIYGGPVDEVLNTVLRHRPCQRVLLAGHSPSVGELVNYLCDNEFGRYLRFRTGEIARVDLPDHNPVAGEGNFVWKIPAKAVNRMLSER